MRLMIGVFFYLRGWAIMQVADISLIFTGQVCDGQFVAAQ